jgi:hypothetical protein
MKSIHLFFTAFVIVLVCRAANPVESQPGCLTRGLKLIGLAGDIRPANDIFDQSVLRKAASIGDRQKILEWLCLQSDLNDIGFILDYKNKAFIIKIWSVDNGIKNEFYLQFVFDQNNKLEKVRSGIAALGPYP